MSTFESIIFVSKKEKYEATTGMIEQRYKNTMFINDFNELFALISADMNSIGVVFIEYELLAQGFDGLAERLRDNNVLWIALTDNDEIIADDFLYDVLYYTNEAGISNYLTRLEKDINCRFDISKLECEIDRFYTVGKGLTLEKDISALLDLIINSCLELTSSDAGTIYLIVDEEKENWSLYKGDSTSNKFLKFGITKNRSIKTNLKSVVLPITSESIVGNTVINGRSIRIDDAYNISPKEEYKFNPTFDIKTGYKTQSMLSVPMKDHTGHIIGVIQLINKKGFSGNIPFAQKDEKIISSFAGQAAIALENSLLYREMEELLEKYRLMVSEEIVKRKNADKEIDKLLSAVEHSPIAVSITDSTGVVEYANPKLCELTGYSLREIIGKDACILRPEQGHNQENKEIWSTIKSGREWKGEIYCKRKMGEDYWSSVSISSIVNENKEIKYLIILEEDISEKKLMENEIRQKNSELQHTIKMLKETQMHLIHQEKMAGIGNLAAGIAHEINNPLGFIISNLDILKKYNNLFKVLFEMYCELNSNTITYNQADLSSIVEAIDIYKKDNKIDFLMEDLESLFGETKEGLQRVAAIVNALRAFADIDRIGAMEQFDLNEGINATLTVAGSEVGSSAQLDVDLGILPLINADSGDVNQVILALLMNSVYAIKEKNIDDGKINVKTYSDEKHVYLEIEDNGIGIDENNISKIFNPFFTTKPEGQGVGLGLSVAYDIIVNKHKGDISIESEYGQGSKFTIKLPIN